MKITIKKGKHYASGIHVRPYLGKRVISWRVKMDKSCLYAAINDDSNDLNKLCGISFGHHHNNSLRFAWRPDFNNSGQISIYAYWYEKGIRNTKYIVNINHSVAYLFQLEMFENGIEFYILRDEEIGKGITEVIFTQMPLDLFGYYLWPYFGGNNTAPHEMKIDLKIL